METKFKPGDYLVFISSGSGANPNDKGKVVRYLEHNPSGDIANDMDFYDTYFQFLPGIYYETGSGKCEFGKARANMFRVATDEELSKLNLINNNYQIY